MYSDLFELVVYCFDLFHEIFVTLCSFACFGKHPFPVVYPKILFVARLSRVRLPLVNCFSYVIIIVESLLPHSEFLLKHFLIGYL